MSKQISDSSFFQGGGRAYRYTAERHGGITVVEIRTPSKRLVRLEVWPRPTASNVDDRERAALMYVEGRFHSTIYVETSEHECGAPLARVWSELEVPGEDEGPLAQAIEDALAHAEACL